MAKLIIVEGVDWDGAEDLSSKVELSIEVEIFNSMDTEEDLENFIENELSNVYGFCHNGWETYKVKDVD